MWAMQGICKRVTGYMVKFMWILIMKGLGQGKVDDKYVFTIYGGLIIWKSKLQPTVELSITKAEYIAASLAIKEALWL